MMNLSTPLFAASAGLAIVTCSLDACGQEAAIQRPAAAGAALSAAPLVFVPNVGQWPQQVHFAAQRGAVRHWLAEDGLWAAAASGDLSVALHFAFEESAGQAHGVDCRSEVRNFLLGEQSHAGVPVYSRVRHRDLYEGTDLVLRSQDGHLEYDLVLEPGADLRRVSVRVAGHDRMRLLPDGSLAFDTAIGVMRQTAPKTWVTDAAGARLEVPSRFVVLGPDRYGFAVEGWAGGELTIDPGLVWGSFLGGAGVDRCSEVGLDSTGHTIVAGVTNSNDFPTTAGSYRTSSIGSDDGFVASIGANGTALSWCTYIGGSLDEVIDDLQVLPGDRVAISGSTRSPNYPTTANRFQGSSVGGAEAFMAILTPSGAQLEYSTFFGGIGDQKDVHVWVQPNGNIFLAGLTDGTAPTTSNSFQGIRSGQHDVFFTELDRSIPGSTSMRYGTYFGGTGDESIVSSLHVDANNIATIGVTTESTGLPTTSTAYQTSLNGVPPAGFILCLQSWIPQTNQAPTGPASYVYGSYFNMMTGSTERLIIDVDSDGFFVVTGTTSCTDWATLPISSQPSYGGGASDGIVTRFDAGSSTGVLLATYVGGSGDEVIYDTEFEYVQDTIELLSLVGTTTSTNLPVSSSALQASPAGTGVSGFLQLTDFRAPGPLMRRYASYFDGCQNSDDALLSVTKDSNNDMVVAGYTESSVAPGTAGGFQIVSGGSTEGLVARLDQVAQPALFATFGAGCGPTGGVPTFAPTTSLTPRMCQPFQCTVNNLQSNNVGIMLMGLSNTNWLGLPLPRDLGVQGMPGCFQLVSTDATFVLFHATSSLNFGFAVPGSMAFYAIDLHLQFLELDLGFNAAGFRASNGASLNIQF
ncbi:MAG: hypothetical protein VYE77_05745 [Planctomycetota bacterium]|nr:hypothetical protein [Planctomycetota bacterium]